MDNGGKNEAFFTGLLNKTRKDKIFIVILAGILMMVIAMPTKSSSAKVIQQVRLYPQGQKIMRKILAKNYSRCLKIQME